MNQIENLIIGLLRMESLYQILTLVGFIQQSSQILLTPPQYDFPVAQMVKHLPTVQETQVQSMGQEDLLEKDMATHSSILAWKIP